MNKEKYTTFIPDIHGDYDAFKNSLNESKHVRVEDDGTVTKLHEGEMVLLGDLIDRGTQNLAVLDLALRLREKVRTVVLMGNHEALMLQSLSRPGSGEWAFNWLYNGGLSVMKEIATQENIPAQDAYGCESFEAFLVESLGGQDISGHWQKSMLKYGAIQTDIWKTYPYAQSLMLRGKYRDLFQGMQITYRPTPGVVAVHASIPEFGVRNLESANERLREAWQQEEFGAFAEASRDWARFLWPRTALPETDETPRRLAEQGIHLIVHGHNPISKGIPSVHHYAGVSAINADVAMSDAFSGYPAKWGYIQLLHQTGDVFGASSVQERYAMGTVKSGSFSIDNTKQDTNDDENCGFVWVD